MMKNPHFQIRSRKAGLAALKVARRTNPAARLYQEARTYTQPGRGVVTHVRYWVEG